MDAAQALADLTEISTQIEAAVILDSSGTVLASSMTEAARSDAVARAARELFTAAEESMGGADAREKLVQLQAVIPDACVFAVRDDDRVLAAVTTPDPTVGLVFYDLKTCLRHVAGESLTPKPKARSGSKKAEKAASEEGSGDGAG
jgi:predicted regulator of Ras-like GTPase activity (Roadblock/LC7/MglB family)